MDIIKIYGDYMHEILVNSIRDYWDSHYSQFQTLQIIELAFWIFKYNEELKLFIEDVRLLNAVDTLLGIYLDRMYDNGEKIIDQILQAELKEADNLKQKASEDDEILQTTIPSDLFKIINSSFDTG